MGRYRIPRSSSAVSPCFGSAVVLESGILIEDSFVIGVCDDSDSSGYADGG